jgi:predicted ester cyclase
LNEREGGSRFPSIRRAREGDLSEQNKAALRRAVERFNGGDEAYFNFYTEDVTVNGLPGAPVLDRDGLISFYRAFWAAFPKAAVEVLDVLAEEELMASRFRITGDLESEFMGVLPDGKSISVEALNLFRMTEDGRCVERWVRMDELAFMTQLGLIPAAVNA